MGWIYLRYSSLTYTISSGKKREIQCLLDSLLEFGIGNIQKICIHCIFYRFLKCTRNMFSLISLSEENRLNFAFRAAHNSPQSERRLDYYIFNVNFQRHKNPS